MRDKTLGFQKWVWVGGVALMSAGIAWGAEMQATQKLSSSLVLGLGNATTNPASYQTLGSSDKKILMKYYDQDSNAMIAVTQDGTPSIVTKVTKNPASGSSVVGYIVFGIKPEGSACLAPLFTSSSFSAQATPNGHPEWIVTSCPEIIFTKTLVSKPPQ